MSVCPFPEQSALSHGIARLAGAGDIFKSVFDAAHNGESALAKAEAALLPVSSPLPFPPLPTRRINSRGERDDPPPSQSAFQSRSGSRYEISSFVREKIRELRARKLLFGVIN